MLKLTHSQCSLKPNIKNTSHTRIYSFKSITSTISTYIKTRKNISKSKYLQNQNRRDIIPKLQKNIKTLNSRCNAVRRLNLDVILKY